MAVLGTFTKQPGETLDFDIDYVDVLAGRVDTIASQSASVSPAGLTIVSTVRNTGNTVVKVTVSGGTASGNYKVTVLATSNAATPLIYEDEVNVLVEET